MSSTDGASDAAWAVDTDELAAVHAQLRSAATQVDDELGDLSQAVAGLLAHDWRGSAADSLQQVFDQWAHDGAESQANLAGLAEALAKIERRYDELHLAVGQAWSR